MLFDLNPLLSEDQAYSASIPMIGKANETGRARVGELTLTVIHSDGRREGFRAPVYADDAFEILRAHADACEASSSRPTFQNGCIGTGENPDETKR